MAEIPKDVLRAWAAAQPPVLYHYTDAKGLLGILRSRRLWASDARFLNDTSELAGYEQGWADLARRSRPESNEPSLGYALLGSDGEHGALDKKARETVRLRLCVYVTSLTSLRDDLAMWRGYCGGSGFSVGFDSGKLIALVESDRGNVLPVYYADAPLAQEASRLTDLMLTPFRKHPAFSHEKEIRAVFIEVRTLSEQSEVGEPDGQMRTVEVRATARGLCPYIEVPGSLRRQPIAQEQRKPLPLAEITIGPCLNFDEQELALRMVLEENGYEDKIKIKASTVPYRA